MACSANQEVPGKDHYGFQGLSSSAFVRCLRHSPPYRWTAGRQVSLSFDQMSKRVQTLGTRQMKMVDRCLRWLDQGSHVL